MSVVREQIEAVLVNYYDGSIRDRAVDAIEALIGSEVAQVWAEMQSTIDAHVTYAVQVQEMIARATRKRDFERERYEQLTTGVRPMTPEEREG